MHQLTDKLPNFSCMQIKKITHMQVMREWASGQAGPLIQGLARAFCILWNPRAPYIHISYSVVKC
jgi:hypothetical protein